MPTSPSSARGTPALLVALALLSATACNLGPDSVVPDHRDYTTALGETWKQQMLRNIVRLRYAEPLVFLNMTQIVAGYTLETSGSLGGTLFEGGNGLGTNNMALGVAARYQERPTISYQPSMGKDYLRDLLVPLSPLSVMQSIQSGFRADVLFRIAVSSINGLKNDRAQLSGYVPADPGFERVSVLLAQLQESGSVGVRVKRTEGAEGTVVVFQTDTAPAEVQAAGVELRALLGLDADAKELDLVVGGAAQSGHQLALQTRSLVHVLNQLASHVAVPPLHVQEGRAAPGSIDAGLAEGRRKFHVYSSEDEPDDAYVAIEYKDHWFWIDDRDLLSKRAVAFLMLLFSLADSGGDAPPAMVTISAQ